MNWDQRIAKAEIRGWFTDNDKLISGSWKKCSLGEKFKIKSLSEARLIVDGKPFEYGVEFCEHVCKDRVKQAKKLHEKIKGLKP